VRTRITLHPELDLSGFLDQLDAWGDRFPTHASLGPAAVAAASRIVRELGRSFDVCVSTCVLSQLANPFRRAWALPAAEWVSLDAALTGVHLTTLAGATRSGGKGLLAFDVLTSDREPALAELATRSDADVAAFAQSALEAGKLWPNPQQLLAQLSSPGLAQVLASPRASSPWLWDIKAGVQLVYGLSFDRL
jgi:hypothetical protein